MSDDEPRDRFPAPSSLTEGAGDMAPSAWPVAALAPPRAPAWARAVPMPVGAMPTPSMHAPIRGTERQVGPGILSERKLVTILFADIVDSLRAIEGVDPEEAHALLSATLDAMAQAVRAYGGSVANTMGDGIMAVFGAPLAQEDHAMRACHAALLLHDWVAGIRPGSDRVAVRVGLHSGEVAIGTAPAEISATGAAVHIASRLQQLAAPGRTVLSAETSMLVQAEMLTEPLGRFALKGLERSVDLHRLLGPLPAQPRPEHRRQASFVGRGAPLAALLEAHAAALQGRGALLAVSGEAGIGKTALVERFLAARPPAARLVRGAAERYLSAAPFQPLRALMLDLLELHQVAPEERRAALLARLQVLDLTPEISAPPLLELFDLASADVEWARLGAQQRRARMAASFAELLLRESRHCPLLVVLEDLQWADSATIDLLGLLARQLGTHGILLLLTHRPEFQPPWADSPIFRALRLDRLDEEETRALIRHQAGAGLLPLLERRILALSRGNPLFLRESINALIEAGMVAPGPAGAPAATLPDPETIAIPRSVTAVIAERIDRLAPDAKAVLLAASVIGAQFSLDLLARLTREPPERLPEQLRILERAEFLRSVDPAAGLYAFDHALFQEVGYATLLKANRRRLHEAAFLALRQRQRQREPEAAQVESLAFHALHGELWEEAFRLCWRAGRRAAARYAHREAAHHLENALHALGQADPDGLRLESALELRLELRAASLPLLRLDRVGGLLEEARQLAQRLGHRDQLARITGFLAGHAYLTRSAKPSEALCREALQLCREGTDPYLRIAPSLYLAQALYGLGRYGEVLRVLNPVLRNLDAGLPGAALGLPVRPLLMGWYWLAIAQAELGRFAPARQLCERMLTIADELLPFEYIYAETAAGFVLMLEGQMAAAREASARALAAADERDIAFIIPVLGSQLGYQMAATGQAAEGVALARRGMQAAERIGVYAGRSRWCARLAEACLAAGLPEEGMAHAETALRLAEAGEEAGYVCSALRLRAKARLWRGGSAEAARQDLLRAAETARRLHIGPALAKAQLDLGLLERMLGRPGPARQHWRRAEAGFRRLGMEVWAGEVAARRDRSDIGPAALTGSAE